MPYVFNPFTGNFDWTAGTSSADTFDPSGWLPAKRWNKATVAVSTTKLKITLSSTTNLQYYWRGNKTDLGATTLEVTSTEDKSEGIWYCYSSDGTNFILSKTAFYIFDYISGAIRADLMAWEFYWDNTNDVAIWIQPEFHSAALSRQVHGYLHESLGTRYANGLEISYGTTYADTATRVKLTSGEIHDEDISVYITHDATPTEMWEQILGSVGTADINYAALPIFYLSGATPVWRKVTASSYPFLPVSNNYIYYNRLNAGSWDYTTSLGSSDFVVYWIIATSNQTDPICIIPGRLDNANLTAAEAEAFPSASVSTLFTEYKILYRIIYQTSAAASNNGKCKINKVTDYRKDALSNNTTSGGATSAALVAFTPAGNIASTNVQAAIEELDTEKAGLALANIFTADNRGQDFIGTRSATITRTGDYISSVAKTGGRTITITRDGNNYITSVTDGTNTWTLTRDGNNKITAVTVT